MTPQCSEGGVQENVVAVLEGTGLRHKGFSPDRPSRSLRVEEKVWPFDSFWAGNYLDRPTLFCPQESWAPNGWRNG